jgi:Domain of unknown function (DUF4160)
MPTISIFFGIVVQMYWRDHPPAHFHAYYQGFEGLFSIDTGELIEGQMSVGSRRVLKAWTLRHQAELLGNWERCRLRQSLLPVMGADEE